MRPHPLRGTSYSKVTHLVDTTPGAPNALPEEIANQMRVLVTGATGFIGRALVMRLLRSGHEVTAWVRSKESARAKLGSEVALVGPQDGAEGALERVVTRADAVVNLAGEPIIGPRWTKARKAALLASRVDVTRAIVDGLASSGGRPRVLVSASAIGFYGSRGDEVLDEQSTPGSDFLADICTAWEAEAERARTQGVRLAIVRIGVVLGAGGGALSKMLPPFKLGAGGPIASGKQWMSWIHLEDLVEALVCAVEDERYEGVINGVGPNPVRNSELTRALGRALHRPAFMPVPSFALKLAFGEASATLLGSQRVLPKTLLGLGFRFRHPTIESALADIVGGGGNVEIGAATKGEDDRVPKDAGVRYKLQQRALIDAPIATVFAFFSRAENLGALTPPDMTFDIQTPLPIDMHAGTMIDYKMKVGPIPLRWRTAIERFDVGTEFVDSQARGPYAAWWHVHRFTAVGSSTLVEDRVYYTPPLGILGRLVHGLFIAPKLREVFAYRERTIRLRFGAPSQA